MTLVKKTFSTIGYVLLLVFGMFVVDSFLMGYFDAKPTRDVLSATNLLFFAFVPLALTDLFYSVQLFYSSWTNRRRMMRGLDKMMRDLKEEARQLERMKDDEDDD